jgi:plasmid stabilization system protein ParE
MDELDRLFALIATQPGIGRVYPTTRKRWQRIEHGSHVVLYSQSPGVITIQRVLHRRQLLLRAAR